MDANLCLVIPKVPKYYFSLSESHNSHCKVRIGPAGISIVCLRVVLVDYKQLGFVVVIEVDYLLGLDSEFEAALFVSRVVRVDDNVVDVAVN